MKELIVSKQIAEKLKTVGYDQKTMFGYNKTGNIVAKIAITIRGSCRIFWDKYDDELPAPTFQEVIDWFREEHNINCEVNHLPNISKYGVIVSDKTYIPKNYSDEHNYRRGPIVTCQFSKFDNYHQAREFSILKAIELCQKEK